MAYAYAVVTSLMATIDHHFLQPNPNMLLQNKEKIQSMYEKLRFVQAFLEGTEKRAGDLEALEDVLVKIRDVAVEAEAKIELRLRKFYMAAEWRKRRKEKAHRRLHLTLRQVIDDTEELMKIVNTARDSANNSRRGKTISGDGAPALDRVNTSAVVGCQDTIVGCDEDLTMLLDRLTRESKQREVVSIVGMGGIGKTTLAYRIYKDSLVSSHFDLQAWITVSQECNFRGMLLDVLHCVTKITAEMYKEVEDELADRLRKILMGRRYLIVMDDIWSVDLWDDIQRCFPDNGNGSRILLTTRLKEVAGYTSSGNNCYNMPFLDSNQSWNLFYKKVLEGNEFPLEFLKIGRDIVEKCSGLPLAINVIAGLLSKTKKRKGEWENIAKNVSKFVSSDPNQQCSRILALSYNHLPLHLKICFLYLGIFPRDTEIPVKTLEKLWVAEGILGGESSKRVEEVANAKLQDLIDRSLVITCKHSFDGKIKTCRMHDLLHGLCLSEAQREILLSFSNEDEESQSKYLLPKTLRWLSVGSHRYDDFHLYHIFGKFRSILFFMNLEYFHDLERKLVFLRSKLLRVLDIASVQIPYPGVGILNLIVQAGLVHLRYLALRFSSKFEETLPSSQLWSLQTYIAVYGKIDTRKLPTRIMKLPLLRHLCFDKIYISHPSLVVPESLETMLWLDHRSHTKEIFQRLSNLKELGIKGDGSKGLNEPDWPYNLVYLCQVETLRIAVSMLTCSMVLPCWSSFPPNLKKLMFSSTQMPWKDMNVIGMLPNLEMLKLKNKAFIGPHWEPEEGGFCRLKYLLIKDTDLMQWEVNGDYFPILERLSLRYCFKLEELPIGFADITTLQLIELEDCNPSLLTSAKHIQEEQQNYGNDALLVRHYFTRFFSFCKSLEP